MRILAINGSPHKGSSYAAVERLAQRLTAHGDVEFEHLHLKDVTLGECRGCIVCFMAGEEKCPLGKDAAALVAKLQAADGIILVSPVYSMQVSSLMKRFIDRLSYLWHRPSLFRQKVLVVASSGGGGPVALSTLKYLATCATRWGAHVVAKLNVPNLTMAKGRALQTALADIDAKAERFYQALHQGGLPAPTFGQLMFFRIWQNNSRYYTPEGAADKIYWRERGWLDAKYYYPAPVSSFKAMLAGWIGILMHRVTDRAFGGE